MAVSIKGRTAPKAHRSEMETKIISLDQVDAWKVPPFQRPVRVNAKVQQIADALKADGVSITGTITLGKLTDDRSYYIVDGQHRLQAFRMSGLKEVIADVRIIHFDTMAEMADEFVNLNTSIVRMRPDDLLRGLAPSLPPVQAVLDECPFVGFDNLRRNANTSSLVGLSTVLRCWTTSANDTPSSSSSGITVSTMAHMLTEDESEKLIGFLTMAHDAWGRDPEYYRLWGNLNMALCMWLYRRLVLDTQRRGNYRVVVLTKQQFKSCLMALSANGSYLEWLQGRLLNDRDRSPGYVRMKQIFVRRLTEDSDTKINMPAPAWASK